MVSSHRVNAVYIYDITISGLSSTGGEHGIRYGDNVHTNAYSGMFPRMFLNFYRYFGKDWNPASFTSNELWKSDPEAYLSYGTGDKTVSISRTGIPTFFAYRKGNLNAAGKKETILGWFGTTNTFSDQIGTAFVKNVGGTAWTTAEIRTWLNSPNWSPTT